jgi:hypothetical protein
VENVHEGFIDVTQLIYNAKQFFFNFHSLLWVDMSVLVLLCDIETWQLGGSSADGKP